MLKTVENVVVIPQEYEDWKGVASLPRVRELLSVGLTKRAIANRFRISVQSIDKALLKEKARADQDTSPETNPTTGLQSHEDHTQSDQPLAAGAKER